MSVPYSELVIREVLISLQKIRTAAGYNTDVLDVRRWSRYGDERGSLRNALEVWIAGESKRQEGSEFIVDLEVGINCFVEPSEDVPRKSTDELMNLLAHDVSVALAAINYDTLGVLLASVDITAFSIGDPTDPQDGCLVTATFQYTVDIEDQHILLSPSPA
jgi:hypothetical protein